MIYISQNINNSQPSFKSGLTRKLRRNFYPTESDVIEIFNQHENKKGIAGELPKSWIKKLNKTKFVASKKEAINDIFKEFGEIVKLASINIEEATKNLNKLLQKHHILTKKQNYNIKKIDTSESLYIKNGYILKGKHGIEDLFVKEFRNYNDISLKRRTMITEIDGKFVELARALQINHQIKDPHIMHTNWGDTKFGYMVSEYIKPLRKKKTQIEIKEVYENEKELIQDLYKKYGFSQEEIKKNNVKIGYEYKNKFYSYPKDIIIYNYFNSLFEKYHLRHHDIKYNENNYIVTIDKNGNSLLKLIDFGKITKN